MRPFTKEIKFPSGGLGRAESFRDYAVFRSDGKYPTPDAKNVWGACPFHNRFRGGSRPGFVPWTHTSSGVWCWPNGEPVCWPDTGDKIVFSEVSLLHESLNGIHIVDPHQEIVDISAASGNAPSSFSVSTFYRHRLILGSGSVFYASAEGDVHDFDYGRDMDDVSRPLSGNVGIAGRDGDEITGFAAIEDSTLYISTRNSLFAWYGNLVNGRKVISSEVGFAGKNSWCWNGRSLWFLSVRGLWRLSPGEELVCVSRHLPADLREAAENALLVFDPEYEGIHIFLDRGAGSCHWFVDEYGSFWPTMLSDLHTPVAAARIERNGTRKCVFRCKDGNWRTFDCLAESDDGGSGISSYVDIGPVRLSSHDSEDALLDAIMPTFGLLSGSLIITVRTADSAEAVFSSDPVSFCFSSGRNHNWRCRRRGAWALFRIASTYRWAFESLELRGHYLGRLR